ncbi:MAG: cohesin domain-containing protein [Patescibacteria group bacterium]|nr:hypothetical protein [Patescibacteria group bacterium]MBU1877156.1 hypothetical protein [Patescibacteria group bacterium]
MKKIFLILFIVFLLFFSRVDFVKAQGASLYLSPQSGTFFVGSIFNISVFVNTEGNSINAVQVDLKFPPNLLQVTSPTAGSSFISIWADQPFYSNQEGIISFKGGVLSPGINTSSGLISTITFRAKVPGQAVISFLDSSKILLADAKGTDILKTATRGEYLLAVPPPEGPKISSPTHTCLTCWSKNNNPTFFWEKESGVTNFSYSLDQDPRGIPDNISEGSATSTTFNDVLGGVWYFHLKAEKGDVWGGISHYPIQIDTAPPGDFTINIEKVGEVIGSRFFANFSTNDLLSGMDYYEVSTVNMTDPQATLNPFFVEANSPYKIPFESSGKYAILVKAYDKAGNFVESRSILNIISPFISWTENGIRIKNLFLPWWLIYSLTLLIFGLSGFGIYLFLLKKKSLAQRLKKEVAEAEKEIDDVGELEKRIGEMKALEEEAGRQKERLIEKLGGPEKK